MITYPQAVDEIFKTVYDAIKASTVLTYIPEVRFQGVEKAENPPLDKYWLRVSQQTIEDAQTSFRTGLSGKTFTNTGLLIVQLFCPKTKADAMTKGRLLAIIVRDSLRKNSENVWFRNSKIVELQPEDNWRRFNIVADYNFDEQF